MKTNAKSVNSLTRWPKRIFLFVAVNLLVVLTISLITSLLGVQPYLTAQGIDYSQLLIFCLLWGMGGSFISLALSRILAKSMMGVHVINPEEATADEIALVETVHRLAHAAGIKVMPQVGIYVSPEVNAFATGPTKNRALVAVSTGLLERLSQHQVEGVLGHEIAHVANGDMVTMALVQGVVNAFVMFFARIVAYVISLRVEEKNAPMVRMFATFAFEIVFGILGMMVVAGFSRFREFRADAGGAQLAGRQNMISALAALSQLSGRAPETDEPQSLAAFKISGKKGGSPLLALFSTHPPLEERIARLRSAA